MKERDNRNTTANDGRSKAEKLKSASNDARWKAGKRRFIRNIIIAAAVAAVFAVAVLFIVTPVSYINVVRTDTSGNADRYTDSQIAEATGIKTGTVIFTVNTGKAEESVEKLLPYIGEANIKRGFPNKIIVEVTSARAAYGVPNGDKFVLLDKNGKVLENMCGVLPAGTARLKGAQITKCEVGQKASFTEDDIIDVLSEIIAACDKYGFDEITAFNVTSLLNIKFVYKNFVTIEIGDSTDIDAKIQLAWGTYQDKAEKGIHNEIIIRMSDGNKAFVRTDTGLEEIETTTLAPEPTSAQPVTEAPEDYEDEYYEDEDYEDEDYEDEDYDYEDYEDEDYEDEDYEDEDYEDEDYDDEYYDDEDYDDEYDEY